MKSIRIFSLLFLLSAIAFVRPAAAQASKTETLVIKTSAVCETCKASIERAVAFEKGVKAVNLNVETRELTVTYRGDKVTPLQLRTAVSKVGYDADEVPADPKAYQKIDECCKKENMVH